MPRNSVHKETRNPKAVLQENLKTNIENKPSTKNTNEAIATVKCLALTVYYKRIVGKF